MAPPHTTNYAGIQEDEVEALRSIYMDDFQEEMPKIGAWNKSSDRAFRIVVKPATADLGDISIISRASLPATYPKTLPRLSLEFSEEVREKTRAEAERVLKTKPKTLVGTEMIFEITASLQDILDQNLRIQTENVPTLDEERASRQAVITRQAQRLQEEKGKETTRASIEEEQYLQEMVDHQKAREERRRTKMQTCTSQDPEPIPVYGSVQFDQPAVIRDPEGDELTIDAIHDKAVRDERHYQGSGMECICAYGESG